MLKKSNVHQIHDTNIRIMHTQESVIPPQTISSNLIASQCFGFPPNKNRPLMCLQLNFQLKIWPCSGHLIKNLRPHFRKAIVSTITYWNLGENRAKISEIRLKEHCHADSCFQKKSPPIDNTRKSDFLVLSPLIKNLTMMTSSKWKINVISLVENCSNYNISKFGWKSTTGKRDNLT